MGNENTFLREINLTTSEFARIRSLLRMTGKEIFDSFKMVCGDKIVRSADFDDGFRMDVRLVVRDGDAHPYTEAVLYKNNKKLCCTHGCGYVFDGTWSLMYDDKIYMVKVFVGAEDDDAQIRIRMKGGWLVTKRCKDVDNDGVEIFFETVNGDIVDIVGVNALPDTDKIDVYTFSDAFDENYTNEFTLNTEEICEATE